MAVHTIPSTAHEVLEPVGKNKYDVRVILLGVTLSHPGSVWLNYLVTEGQLA